MPDRAAGAGLSELTEARPRRLTAGQCGSRSPRRPRPLRRA